MSNDPVLTTPVPEAKRLLAALAGVAQSLAQGGLAPGSSGNVSARVTTEVMAISPSGWRLGDLTADDFVLLSWGDTAVPPLDTIRKDRRASSEWRLHQAVYTVRPKTHAVVHTHGPHATALACLERTIPPFHYYLALLGDEVPLVPYAPYGSPKLAQLVADALGSHPSTQALLLAHHGTVTLGATPEEALTRAEVLEHLAQIYLLCLSTGSEPPLLSPEALAEAADRMTTNRRETPDREATASEVVHPSQGGVAPRGEPCNEVSNQRQGKGAP